MEAKLLLNNSHNINSKAKTRIKVSIVDDDKTYRDSLIHNLEADKRISIFGIYSSGNDFIRSLNDPFKPDVCLVDVVLNDISGIECCRKIKETSDDIHVIIMTAYPDLKSFSNAVAMGADYIEKGTLIESIIYKIVAAYDRQNMGHVYSLADDNSENLDFLGLAHEMAKAKDRLETLSPAQKNIIRLRLKGKSIKNIAEELQISPNTVQKQINRAYKKIDLPNLLEFIFDK